MTPSASVGPSKKRKGESASAGPSKRAKKGGRRVAKKTSVKMEEHKTSPLVMHPSMYCEWPEKMSGDAAFQRQFVQCDTCDLWFHYGCVAFVPNEDPWSCPASTMRARGAKGCAGAARCALARTAPTRALPSAQRRMNSSSNASSGDALMRPMTSDSSGSSSGMGTRLNRPSGCARRTWATARR
ncbi:hypothetical protein BV25DRAFT_308906 [Artomyces pyxidatus]|uniref:Uncharacterized protein n=1 Tax=Artomyces pyxidatus TaxID=48021 RepID=A0ACB8T852_9AGAM|nr:hypothetical protein BV25DRAFT_308906 [Artomyces pyxidatus]